MNKTKRCCHCLQEKHVSEFYASNKSKDGYYSRCKQCYIRSTPKPITQHMDDNTENHNYPYATYWEQSEIPEEYDTLPNIALIEIVTGKQAASTAVAPLTSPKTISADHEFKIVVIDNVFPERTSKVKHHPAERKTKRKSSTTTKRVVTLKGELSYLEIDKVDSRIAKKLLSEWDRSMPISIFASMKGYGPYLTPFWKRTHFHAIKSIRGTVSYFSMEPTSVKKRRIIPSDTPAMSKVQLFK